MNSERRHLTLKRRSPPSSGIGSKPSLSPPALFYRWQKELVLSRQKPRVTPKELAQERRDLDGDN